MKEKTISNAFRKSGMFPSDVKVVLRRMKQYKNPEPSLPLLITDQNVFSTPKSISHGLKAGEAWQKKLEKVLSSPSQRKFCSFVKGNEVLWHGLELMRGGFSSNSGLRKRAPTDEGHWTAIYSRQRSD